MLVARDGKDEKDAKDGREIAPDMSADRFLRQKPQNISLLRSFNLFSIVFYRDFAPNGASRNAALESLARLQVETCDTAD